jgi:hypothetical protein
MKRILTVAILAGLFLAAGSILSAKGDGKGCPMMKGKKDKAACCMGMDLKACKFTDKAVGKDDKPCYVCPDRDSCSAEPGKCPKCGKVLEKKFCPMMKGDWSQGKGKDRVMYMCPMDKTMSKKPGKCPKCGMAMEKVECPMKKGQAKNAEKKAPDDVKAVPTAVTK